MLVLMILASFAFSETKVYQKGTITEMTSVPCGYDQKPEGGFAATVLGVDSDRQKTRQALCPEYTVKTDRVIYKIRPLKEEKHPVLLPVAQDADFRIKKDRMVLKVPEFDNNERDYQVVGMEPNHDTTTNKVTATRASK
jgi:hypothetical protein